MVSHPHIHCRAAQRSEITCLRSHSNFVEELDPESRFPDAEQKGRVQLANQLINNLRDLAGAQHPEGQQSGPQLRSEQSGERRSDEGPRTVSMLLATTRAVIFNVWFHFRPGSYFTFMTKGLWARKREVREKILFFCTLQVFPDFFFFPFLTFPSRGPDKLLKSAFPILCNYLGKI